MNKFQIIFTRLFLMNTGSLDGLESTKVGQEIMAKFKRQRKFSKFEDFVLNKLGYVDDAYLSPSERFSKRMEIVNRSKENKFIKNIAISKGFKRSSEVVEYLDRLGVLGVGRDYISMKPQKFSFKDFESFLNDNKELITVFCTGAEIMQLPGLGISFNDIKLSFCNSSLEEVKKGLDNLKLTPTKLVRPYKAPGKGKVNKMTPYGLEVSSDIFNSYSKDFISDCVLYAFIVGADKINVRLKTSTEFYLFKAHEFFTCTNEEFMCAMDLSSIYGDTVYNLMKNIGLSLPTPKEMIEKANGLFGVKFKSTGNYILYLPITCTDNNAFPVCVKEENFPDFIKLRAYDSIQYKDNLPYIGDDCLITGDLVKEVTG